MGGAYGTGGKENRKIAMDEKEMETVCLPIMHTVHILAVHLWAYLCKHAIVECTNASAIKLIGVEKGQ